AHAVRLVRPQRGRPFRREPSVIDGLMPLGTLRDVRSGRDTLEVHDGRARLVEHLAAGCANGKGQVGVLVVRGRVARVEPDHSIPERARDRDAGARARVSLAQVVILGTLRILVAAEIPRATVAPDDSTGFLQAPVGVYELRPDDARLR